MTKNEKKKERIKPVVLMFGTLRLDLSASLPMQTGDYTILARQGIKLGPGTNLLDNPDALTTFVLHFCNKINEAITREMVAELPLVRSIKAAQYIQAASQEMDEDPN